MPFVCVFPPLSAPFPFLLPRRLPFPKASLQTATNQPSRKERKRGRPRHAPRPTWRKDSPIPTTKKIDFCFEVSPFLLRFRKPFRRISNLGFSPLLSLGFVVRERRERKAEAEEAPFFLFPCFQGQEKGRKRKGPSPLLSSSIASSYSPSRLFFAPHNLSVLTFFAGKLKVGGLFLD